MKKYILAFMLLAFPAALIAGSTSYIGVSASGGGAAGGSGDMTKAVYDTGDDGAADTANALAANGADCAAGSYALGVDASGAATGCTDATTEIDSAIATHAAVDTAHYGEVQVIPFDFTTDVATGDGAFYFHIGQQHAGKDLTYLHAVVVTEGTTGTQDIQLARIRDLGEGGEATVDMLTTKLTIDSAENLSINAATPYVINASNDDVLKDDVIRVDVDAVHTTAAKGLIVTMGFETP